MGLTPDEILLASKYLHGIPESVLPWFITYLSHHMKALNMQESKVGPRVLYRHKGKNLDRMTFLQIDDAFGHGSDVFLKQKDCALKRIKRKIQKILLEAEKGSFYGTLITPLTCINTPKNPTLTRAPARDQTTHYLLLLVCFCLKPPQITGSWSDPPNPRLFGC